MKKNKKERVGIYLWSGIGDTLLALPLINGLEDNGYKTILLANTRLSHFLSFLKDEGQISDVVLYKTHSPDEWITKIRNLDLLIFPPEYKKVLCCMIPEIQHILS